MCGYPYRDRSLCPIYVKAKCRLREEKTPCPITDTRQEVYRHLQFWSETPSDTDNRIVLQKLMVGHPIKENPPFFSKNTAYISQFTRTATGPYLDRIWPVQYLSCISCLHTIFLLTHEELSLIFNTLFRKCVVTPMTAAWSDHLILSGQFSCFTEFGYLYQLVSARYFVLFIIKAEKSVSP